MDDGTNQHRRDSSIRPFVKVGSALALALGLVALLALALRRLVAAPAHDAARVAALRHDILVEVVKAFGFRPDGRASALLGPIFWLPAQLSARMAVAIDSQIEHEGIAATCRSLLKRFVRDEQVRGQAGIPKTGPLLIAANHPGAYDVALIMANLGRDDVKLVISTLPFIDTLPHLAPHAIQVTRDPHDAMRALRAGVQHLRAGGALIILPTGVVDPDPDLLPGAEAALAHWSNSVDILLRQVPETQLVTTIVSGVLAPGWLHSPIVQVQKEIWRQRKLAEFLQVMQQLLLPGSLLLCPRISFAPPITAAELSADRAQLHDHIVARAQALLSEHMAAS